MAINKSTRTPSAGAKKKPTAKKTAGYYGPYVEGRGDKMKELYNNIGGEYAPGPMGPAVYTKPIGIRPTAPIKLGAQKAKSRKKTAKA